MRTLLRCTLMFALLLFAGVLFAQDRAVPRDREKSDPPRTSHPSPGAAQPNAPSEPATQGTVQPDAQGRRPRPEGRVAPRPPATKPNAKARHPRPDANHAYRERMYRWNDYQYKYWHGSRYPYYFPQWYDGPGWRLLYRGFYVSWHARLPHPEEYGEWFYWPFMNRPQRGCGWYWVPTRRDLVPDPYYDGFRWRYSRWQLIYLCFD